MIEDLPFLATIDMMLMENTPAADVAKYIQEDQGCLTDVNTKTLINALLARRKQRLEMSGMWSGPTEEIATIKGTGEGDDPEEQFPLYRRPAQTPKTLVKKLYERGHRGIQDLVELEGLYLAQRDRIDRMMELEAKAGGFHEKMAGEITVAGELLWKRMRGMSKLGLGQQDEFSMTLSVRGYSEGTAAVLSNPESRHRIMSILQRMVRAGQLQEPEEEIVLPPPQSKE